MRKVTVCFMTLGGDMNNVHKCKCCGNDYPAARAALGYKVCVSCSKEERWSAVPVTYHKTGNTIEVVKDPDEAATITAMMSRSGFGVMRGMKGVKARKSTDGGSTVIAPIEAEPFIPHSFSGREVGRRKMPLDYEGVGLQMMEALETRGKDAAILIVDCAEKEWKLLPKQAVQLRLIIDTLVS